ncbi:LacI family transcriptional regulator [Alloscardovia theropitheci]|uniref:LacI family transcriptional regulator n=1 Tax=Alloscardovia theropitheci TaxID=2496842 RepID=A0A4R0QRD4_9BIFI|nr:LacI family DNA-binding transcriptional regulator [Alloscardovia theropitheci]TCD54914.1 LacI family transcriptional regulator [Alloscardovia theropitheci]
MVARQAGRTKRATLKDVAQAAGVSSTAVSLVLNDKPNRFTEETRAQIRKIAEDLNYVPNQSARSLATRASSLLALFIPDIENLFFVSLAKHLEDECKKQGYSLLIVDTREDLREQENALKRMIQLNIDGLFIVPVRGDKNGIKSEDKNKSSKESTGGDKAFMRSLAEADFPVVFVDRIPDDLTEEDMEDSWRALAYDHRAGGRLAAKLFADRGHTKIGIIGPVESKNSEFIGNIARFEGFVDELGLQKISLDSNCIRNGDFNVSVGRDNADALIDAGVTAVFCGNDLIAIGFTRRARERGKRVPQDISVIGYDDVMTAFGLDFDFTTIRQDVHELAVRSCEAMLNGTHLQKNNKATQISKITMLQPQLVERDTVAVAVK